MLKPGRPGVRHRDYYAAPGCAIVNPQTWDLNTNTMSLQASSVQMLNGDYMGVEPTNTTMRLDVGHGVVVVGIPSRGNCAMYDNELNGSLNWNDFFPFKQSVFSNALQRVEAFKTQSGSRRQ